MLSSERDSQKSLSAEKHISLILPVGVEVSKEKNLAKIVLRTKLPPFTFAENFLSSIKNLKANLLFASLAVSDLKEKEKYTAVFILKFNEEAKIHEGEVEDLLGSLKERGIIEDFYTVFPLSEGFIVDHNIVAVYDYTGGRAAILSRENMESLFIAPRERAEKIGSWIVEIMGENLGRILGETLRDVCLAEGLRRCLEILHAFGSQRGIVHQKNIEALRDSKGGIIRIQLDRNIEEEILREKGISECGRYQLGVYRGFLRSVLGREPESDAVEEIRCISKESNVSEYLIKLPPDALL